MTKNPTLNVGDRVKLAKDPNPNKWWTVRAVSDRYSVLVRQADFRPKGELFYTAVDHEKEQRGSIDLVGYGYGDGTYTQEECERMITALVSGELELSHRNHVPYEVLEYTPA